MGYQMHPETNRDIWIYSPDGELTMLLATRHNERAGAIAPDGTLFAYVSDEKGSDEVYLRTRAPRPVGSGRFRPLVDRSGVEPQRAPALLPRGRRDHESCRSVEPVQRCASANPRSTSGPMGCTATASAIRPFDVAPDGSLILLLTEPSDVRTRVVLELRSAVISQRTLKARIATFCGC